SVDLRKESVNKGTLSTGGNGHSLYHEYPPSFDFMILQCFAIKLFGFWFLLRVLSDLCRRWQTRIEYYSLATYPYPAIAKLFNSGLAMTMRTDDFG
ncbi:MAG: hypothetical protein ACXU9J_02910, partial [Syntrophales bacterium]